MKTALKISILLNLSLLGCLVVWPIHQSKPVVGPAQLEAVATHPAAGETKQSPAPVPPPPRPKPFHWDQLYDQDYHLYVKNLRAIGCPEPAVRAIVAADVHAAFQQRADELEKKLSALASASWSSQLRSWNSEEAWKAQLLHLPDEEAAVFADCLGEKPMPTAVASTNDNSTIADAAEPIVVPLIAQPVDLTALNLDDGQLQAITNLQHSFMEKIGGPNQDPNDPAYQLRWRTAQAEVDNLMQGLLGDQAYQDYQLQVSQASANAPAQPTGDPPAPAGTGY